MDSTLTSVLAALSGSVIGASTPVLSNFVIQRSAAQRELTNREIAQREELYSEFIRQGTSCYAKALSQSLENIDEIVAMYALVNRIRLFASRSVLEAAEDFVKKLVATYGEKNMTIEQIKSVALEQHADPLNDFALKCRVGTSRGLRARELEKQIALKRILLKHDSCTLPREWFHFFRPGGPTVVDALILQPVSNRNM